MNQAAREARHKRITTKITVDFELLDHIICGLRMERGVRTDEDPVMRQTRLYLDRAIDRFENVARRLVLKGLKQEGLHHEKTASQT